jgi:hypothetical protein
MLNINLVFYFDTIRNFTSILIHTSNFFILDIYLFHSITITNCKDITNHQIHSIISNDYINTSARLIHISFADGKDIISDCLNVILTFDNNSQWILISEVQFDSIPSNINNSELITTINNPIPTFIGMNSYLL